MEGRNISVEMPVAVKLNILGNTAVIKRREGITMKATSTSCFPVVGNNLGAHVKAQACA